MIAGELRAAVRGLQAQGRSLREISRLLALSRNTVRRLLREPEARDAEASPCCGWRSEPA
jgi:DNA invertase Pin-like site-specific DNA recombinase